MLLYMQLLDLFRKEVGFENIHGYDDIKDIVKRHGYDDIKDIVRRRRQL